jgi:hypothetical protein
VLGEGLGQLGRGEDALEALRAAVAIADDLVGPPARWRAREALGQVAYALGQDDIAAAAYDEAADLVETFVATLAPERSAPLLASPQVGDVLSAAR